MVGHAFKDTSVAFLSNLRTMYVDILSYRKGL